MKTTISIIVPIYNSEQYLEECIKSLMKQTFKDIEIICVDDGSTDDSARILKQLAKEDNRIKIISQKNSGRSVARNAGLKKVNSEYVMFCDSDDTFDCKMCEKMYASIEKNRTDLAVCEIGIEYESHDEYKKRDEDYYKLKYKGKQKVSDDLILATDTSVCNKIFKTELIQKYNIRFPEDLNNEDYYFCNAYMSVAKSVFYLNQKLYRYIRHDGSIMADFFDKDTYSPDHLLVAIKLFGFYEKHGFIGQHKDLFWWQFRESYWFSYDFSAPDKRKKINAIAREFIGKHYKEFEPSDPFLRTKILMIKRSTKVYSIMRKAKSAARTTYLKINRPYKQRESVHNRMIEIEMGLDEIEERLNKLKKVG